MESCGTSHYGGRRLQSRGLRVQLLPVQYVRPYVRRNKTDRADTDALLEAARCGAIRPVPVKTVEQQTLRAMHRVRTQWQTARVARINAMRGLLAEQGHAIPKGARTGLRRVTAILSDPDAAVPEVLCQTVALVVDKVHGLEDKIAPCNSPRAPDRLTRLPQWAVSIATHRTAQGHIAVANTGPDRLGRVALRRRVCPAAARCVIRPYLSRCTAKQPMA
jgi:hypothetical protein